MADEMSRPREAPNYAWSSETNSTVSVDSMAKIDDGGCSDRDNYFRSIKDLAKYSSIHGIAWFGRTKNKCLRFFIVLFIAMVLTALPVGVGIKYVQHMAHNGVNKKIEWTKASTINYPNITVCNANFFNRRYMAAYNVSNDLANYITFALDTGGHEYIDMLSETLPIRERLERMEVELQTTLRNNNLTTVLDLFHAVADTCDDFIMMCEEHGKLYVTKNATQSLEDKSESCCDHFFHSRPTFSPAGTCFTTKTTVEELSPATYSNIRIWMNIREEEAPEFDMLLLGTNAAERSGIYWTISYEDHPGKVLFSNPNMAAVGTATSVALRKSEVHRTELTGEPCLTKDQTFEDRFGISNTRLNCQMIGSHFIVPDCSIGVYIGLPTVDDLPPCDPSHNLNTVKDPKAHSTNNSLFGFNYACPYDCIHTFYKTSVSTGGFNVAALTKFLDSSIYTSRFRANESAMIQFYFESFDYPKIFLYKVGFFDFLSKVGGWMSLAMGGSVISLIEICGFLLYLGVVFVRNWFRRS